MFHICCFSLPLFLKPPLYFPPEVSPAKNICVAWRVFHKALLKVCGWVLYTFRQSSAAVSGADESLISYVNPTLRFKAPLSSARRPGQPWRALNLQIFTSFLAQFRSFWPFSCIPPSPFPWLSLHCISAPSLPMVEWRSGRVVGWLPRGPSGHVEGW